MLLSIAHFSHEIRPMHYLFFDSRSPDFRAKFGCQKALSPLKVLRRLKAFTHAIEDCLANTQTTHKHALSSLLPFNFQSFKKVQSLTV